jgi:transposase-like protein
MERIERRIAVMALSRRKFARELKVDALRRLETGASVVEVARLHEIDPNVLRRWRRDLLRAPESAFPGPGRTPEESRIAELRRQVERHTQEIDYLRQCVQRLEQATEKLR